ncbi:hypothetical protein FQN57_004011 [Myotisia sp. PD_48]|nr:hypothetical protein FQN57_004011 [Myotisia sp. PD_48]
MAGPKTPTGTKPKAQTGAKVKEDLKIPRNEADIYDYELAQSASKMGTKQYLALRSTWRPGPKNTDPKLWGITRVNEAKAILEKMDGWKVFLRNLDKVERRVPLPPGLLQFGQAYHLHQQIFDVRPPPDENEDDMVRSQSPGDRLSTSPMNVDARSERSSHSAQSSSPAERFSAARQSSSPAKRTPSVGEQPYATALHDSTSTWAPSNDVLSAEIPSIRSEWAIVRKAFEVMEGKNCIFQARSDGCLRIVGPNTIDSPSSVILETKRAARENDHPTIIYQATAQLAAWICREPDVRDKSKKKYHRAMIIRERHDMRVAVATYDDDYIDYIQNQNQPCQKKNHSWKSLNTALGGAMNVPRNQREWTKLARAHNVVNTSIYDIGRGNSASTIKVKQYLMLRGVWNSHDTHRFKPKAWGIAAIKKAQQILEIFPGWETFLATSDPDYHMDPNVLCAFWVTGGLLRDIARIYKSNGNSKAQSTPIHTRLRSSKNSSVPQSSRFPERRESFDSHSAFQRIKAIYCAETPLGGSENDSSSNGSSSDARYEPNAPS